MTEEKIDNFEQYLEHTNSHWQKAILKTSFIGASVTLIIEVFIFLMLLKNRERAVFTFSYIFLRICSPTILNFGSLLIAYLIRKSPKTSKRIKNYFSCFPIFMICTVLSIFHNYFHVLLVTPAFCFCIISVLGDTRILKINALLTVPAYAIATLCFWFDPSTGPAVYKLLTLLTATVFILCSFLFAIAIVKTQAEKLSYIKLNYKRQTTLIEELKIDPLTKLYNRTALKETLTRLITQSRGEGTKPFIAILDLDFFKDVNDKYGHICGDEVLVTLAEIFKKNMGTYRKAFRFGGEEFVLLFDDSFPSQVVYTIGNIRSDFEKTRFDFAPDKSFTLSAGISSLQKNDEPALWLDRADKALYYAKANGRNQIKLSEEQ